MNHLDIKVIKIRRSWCQSIGNSGQKLKFHIYFKKYSLQTSNSFEQKCSKSVNNSCSGQSPCRISLQMGWFLAGVRFRGSYLKILQEM